jgi:hypothetical protein
MYHDGVGIWVNINYFFKVRKNIMNAIKQFFSAVVETIIEARKARASQLVDSLGHRR